MKKFVDEIKVRSELKLGDPVYRFDMLKNIGAKMLVPEENDELGVLVHIDKSIRDYVIAEDSVIASFITRVSFLEKTDEGIYNGVLDNPTEFVPFSINIPEGKASFGKKIVNIGWIRTKLRDQRRIHVNNLTPMIGVKQDTDILIHLLVSVFELILAGYWCDWRNIRANHMTNSGSTKSSIKEIVDPRWLEVYHDKTSAGINTSAGYKWGYMKKAGLEAFFSMYNSAFMAKVEEEWKKYPPLEDGVDAEEHYKELNATYKELCSKSGINYIEI